MLINVLRDEQPTHIAVAFDVSRRSFRNERYADYKAGRSESPSAFGGQVSLVQEVLAALRVPVVWEEDYEADDVIATITARARDQGMQVLICTGDRDAFQLVDDQVTVLYPKRGVSELSRMDPAAVFERYGINPNRYRDLAALVGETSDNLPGVPGVGPKTAAKWLGQFDGLEGLVERVDEVSGKAGQSLRDHLSDVLRNRRVNALVRDMELPVAPPDLEMQPWDRDEIHQVFDSLEFRVLRDRLFETLSVEEPQADSAVAVDGEQLAPGALPAWLDKHAPTGQRLGLTVKGSWSRGSGRVDVLGLAHPDGPAALVDASAMTPDDDQAFAGWLADPDRPKALHDAKGPMHALAAHGWQLRGLTCDTAIAAYLARPD